MNIDYLKKILSIQSYSYDQFRMFAFLIREIKKIEGCSFFVDNGNIHITKGDHEHYPCVVAHMDTVHKIGSDLTVIDIEGNLTGFNKHDMAQTGIGGDDKVGIYIALECLKRFDAIKVAFFRDEEVGCGGSYEAYMKWFQNCGFVLQCDRKGNSDFVTSAGGVELSSTDFRYDVLKIISNYGYKFSGGMMTDVMALKEEGLSVSAANISCGYYNPHMRDEYVNIHDVSRCLEMVMDIIENLDGWNYPHKYKLPKKKKSKKWSVHDKNPLGDKNKFNALLARTFMDDEAPVKLKYCDCCGERSENVTRFPDYQMDICNTCVNEHIIQDK